jgi:hypothetical protein
MVRAGYLPITVVKCMSSGRRVVVASRKTDLAWALHHEVMRLTQWALSIRVSATHSIGHAPWQMSS